MTVAAEPPSAVPLPAAPLPAVPLPAAPEPAPRAVAVGAAAQVGAKVLHLGLNVVSTLAVVRYLAPGEYGVYALVLTVTSVSMLVADFGLPKLAVREITAAGVDASGVEARIVGTVVALRLALAVLSIALTELIMLALGQSGAALVAAAVGSLTGLGEAVLAATVVVFQVRVAQQWEALLRTGGELLETAAILVLIALNASVAMLFVPPAVFTAVAGAVAIAVVRRRFGCRPVYDAALVRPLLTQAAVIAPAIVVGLLFRKMDSFALAAERTSTDVGLYTAAAQPVEYAFLTIALMINTIYPLLSAAHGRGDARRFAELYQRGAEALVIITVAVPLVLLFVAGPFARQVLGAAYSGAATPLVLLAVSIVPLSVAVWQSLALLIAGHQADTLRYNLATLAVAVVLCFGLVAPFGTTGAGSASLATAAFVLLAATRSVRRRLDLTLDVGRLARIAAATALAGGVLAAVSLGHLAWPLVALIGVAAFAVTVRATGAHRSFTGMTA